MRTFCALLAGLWLVACTHTPPPMPPKPKKKTSQESPTRQKKSPSAQSSPQKASEQSRANEQTTPSTSGSKREKSQQKESGQKETPSQEASTNIRREIQKTREETQASQQTSPYPTTAEQREIEKYVRHNRSTPHGAAQSKLEEARKNYRQSLETEKRVASQLEQLKKSGNASPETVKDYEDYQKSVRGLVEENRKIVEQMEAAYARHSSGQPNAEAESTVPKRPGKMGGDPSIPRGQTMGGVAALDREFNTSLEGFDEKLLTEMESIRTESSQKLQDLSEEAAAVAKRLREKGINPESSGESGGESGQWGESESGKEMGRRQGTVYNGTATVGKSRKGAPVRPSQKRSWTHYPDDDIVARQLREAAENETDPELKEKLWQEYDQYKKNSP